MSPVSSDTPIILEPSLEVPALPELFSQSELLREATSAATGEIFRWDSPNGQNYLVKTFTRKSWFSRCFFGKSGIDREWRMLNLLQERKLDFAPRPIAKVGDLTLVMEFISGKELESAHHYQRAGQEVPSKEIYLSIKALLKKLHDAGIVHGDFRRANIMIQSDGSPRIIDWATARTKDTGLGLLYRQLFSSDNYSLMKIITDSYPDLIPEEERAKAKPGPLLRFGRYLRQSLYRHFIKPLHRKHHHSHS